MAGGSSKEVSPGVSGGLFPPTTAGAPVSSLAWLIDLLLWYDSARGPLGTALAG